MYLKKKQKKSGRKRYSPRKHFGERKGGGSNEKYIAQ